MAQNKIALITGGSRGLGKNMALSLAQKGIDVILTYNNNSEAAAEVVNELETNGVKAAALKLDVSVVSGFSAFTEGVKKVLADKFNSDRLDFLINNAGIGVHASFQETTEEQIDQLVNIHFKGAIMLTQNLLSIMNNGGGIINISSGLARFSMPGYAVYGSLKAAMESLTRYQAKELGQRQIRSNIVAPGAIETDFGGGAVRDNQELNSMIASMTALGRVGLPEDIGGVVAFLCTDDARWINGQRIEVSGGMLL